MGYPLSETFVTAPATGYTAVFGGMAATHNSAQQSIDISAPNSQSILCFNETAHGDFWFEADVELLTDPSARRHIGLWMTTGNGSEGHRFAHLDSAWNATRRSSGLGDDAAVTGDINDGAKPIAVLPDVAPSFNVGQRMTLRCEVIVGAFDANGVPWARLIQFKAAGVLMFQIGDAAYRGKLIPGVFLYGATARVHAIAGDTPSGLPAFAATVAVNAQIGQTGGLMRLNSPSSALWNRGGGYDAHLHPMACARRNVHFGGNGQITGTVKEKGRPDQPHSPLVRRVQLISENARVLVAETWSDATGAYRFLSVDPAQRYTVLSYDHPHMYRAVIADNLRPEMMP